MSQKNKDYLIETNNFKKTFYSLLVTNILDGMLIVFQKREKLRLVMELIALLKNIIILLILLLIIIIIFTYMYSKFNPTNSPKNFDKILAERNAIKNYIQKRASETSTKTSETNFNTKPYPTNSTNPSTKKCEENNSKSKIISAERYSILNKSRQKSDIEFK